MKGILFRGIQGWIVASSSKETWAQIKRASQCEEPLFVVSRDYPDTLALALVASAAQELGCDIDEALYQIGKYWLVHIAQATYPTMFSIAGKNPRHFLGNMNRIHNLAAQNTGAEPPRFQYEDLPGGGLKMRYVSGRQLCPLMRGLIAGVSEHFEQHLDVHETSCMRLGDASCTMEIEFR